MKIDPERCSNLNCLKNLGITAKEAAESFKQLPPLKQLERDLMNARITHDKRIAAIKRDYFLSKILIALVIFSPFLIVIGRKFLDVVLL